jgi:hypothetical protein
MNVTNPRLLDVKTSFEAIPKKGRDVTFGGSIMADGDFHTHLQGVAAYRDFQLLTHSDRARKSGRILIADRRPNQLKLIEEFSLPTISSTPPFYYHAGGCQVIGDCLVVPAETGTGRSTVMFFDVSDATDIRELDPVTRILRNEDAGSAGVTNCTESGVDVWWLAAYDNGNVDFYRTADPTLRGFTHQFNVRLKETEHQSFCLLTDTSNRVFAIGLNKTFSGSDRAVLYQVDLVNQTATIAGERNFDTKGGARLRWGASLELVSDSRLVLFCTSKHYDSGCHINAFDPAAAVERAARPTTRRAPDKKRVERTVGSRARRTAPRTSRRR